MDTEETQLSQWTLQLKALISRVSGKSQTKSVKTKGGACEVTYSLRDRSSREYNENVNLV